MWKETRHCLLWQKRGAAGLSVSCARVRSCEAACHSTLLSERHTASEATCIVGGPGVLMPRSPIARLCATPERHGVHPGRWLQESVHVPLHPGDMTTQTGMAMHTIHAAN